MNERLFKCELCKRRCGSQTVLQFHMLNHCKDNENLVCDVCAKTFSSRAALKHHIGTHENEQIECPKCKKVMRNKRSLYFHNRNIHSEEGPFRCEECPHIAPNKRALTKHSNRNHNPISDQFKCKYCGKASKTKLTHRVRSSIFLLLYVLKLHFLFQEHEATHTELRLYTCKFCNLGFNSNANKYKHQKQKHPIEWEKWNQEKNT